MRVNLQPTRGDAVKFDGRVVAQSIGDRSDGSTGGRWHDITVYEKSEGGWVVCIEYDSRCPTESSATDVEQVDQLADVEKVLSVFQPNEYVDRSSFRGFGELELKNVVNRLFDIYYAQVNTILSTLGIGDIEETGKEVVAAESAESQAGLFSRLFRRGH